MGERQTYVYRLVVVRPEGSDKPGWQPPGWTPSWVDPEDGPQPFRWPRIRHCLTVDTAGRWKRRLESWGAQVTIERSNPVTWPDADEG